jgi:hypothetical protein
MVFKSGRPGPRHPLEIRFGEPIRAHEGDRPSRLMERVRLFLAESGAATESPAGDMGSPRRQHAA